MKIQFFGDGAFLLEGKDAKVVLDPSATTKVNKADFVTNSGTAHPAEVKEKKRVLTVPGEFEISGVLVVGHHIGANNVVYRLVMDEIGLVHFGHLKALPNTKDLEKLGENFDLIFLVLHEGFKGKMAKDLIETLEPRMVILGGDATYFPEMKEIIGAKTAEENPLKISKSQFSDEKTEVLILPI